MTEPSVATVLALRRAYWRNGYRPVAIYTKQKRPIGNGWRADALQDPPLWASRRPDEGAMSTGIATGTVVAIDVDVMLQEAVDRIVFDVEQAAGVTPLVRIGKPPKTLLGFRCETPFRKVATDVYLMPDGSEAKVEVLADGQQFVADGIHPDTDRPYHWPAGTPETVPLVEVPALTLAQAQAIIAEARATLLAHGAVLKQAPPRDPKPGKGNGAAAGESFFAQVNAVALSSLGAWVPTLFPRARYERGTQAWRVASRDRGRPDLEEDISFHPAGIRDFGVEDGMTAIDIVIQHAGAPDATHAATWLCERIGIRPEQLGWGTRGNGHDPEGIKPLSGKRPGDEIEHELPIVPWIYQTTSNWEGRAIPDMQWVWPGWIPRQQATGLYGVGGIRKTSLLIQLAVAVATGTSFLGVQMEKMPVCALFCEDVENEVIRKIDAAATHYKLSRRDLAGLHWAALVGYDDPELMTFDRGKGTQTDSLKRLDKWILETGAGLVILDTAAHFFGGEEVNRREVTRFIRQLDAISMIRNCGLVLSRHPSARGRGPGGRMESGSTGWEGSFRSRIALRHPETDDEEEAGRSNERVIELMKSNYAMPGALINCTCEGGVFTLTKVQPGGGVMANSKVGKEACKQRFRELLKKLYDQGRFVSFSKSSPHRYAPTVFAQECGPLSGGYSAIQYAKAMLVLLDEKAIQIEVFGRKSDGKQRLALTTQVKPTPPADEKSMG